MTLVKDLKTQLDEYVKQYETKGFIKSDPVQFPHRFRDKKDIELAGFLASIVAYGKREMFISRLNKLLNLMDNKPFEYIKNFDYKEHNLNGFEYRFSKECDFVQLFTILRNLYSENETLESLFQYSYQKTSTIKGMFQGVIDYFYSKATMETTQGFYHFLPDPAKNSALKRLNMLMRWFVRDGEVDLGIWNFVDKSELLIPLDVHVARISRNLGLLKRNNNDFQSVIELTNELKKFDPKDPIKYDFALFGYGVNN